LFWKCNSIYFWGWGQAQKLFETYLCRQSTSGLEVRSYLFNFDLASFRASFAIFWALRDDFFWPFDFIFFWIGIFLEPTNALEVQSYLFVLNWEKFWEFFCTFWALRAYFFWVRIRFKNFFGPTYVNNQLWFLKYSPIFLFLLVTHWAGPHYFHIHIHTVFSNSDGIFI